jgi:hypothetical protein
MKRNRIAIIMAVIITMLILTACNAAAPQGNPPTTIPSGMPEPGSVIEPGTQGGDMPASTGINGTEPATGITQPAPDIVTIGPNTGATSMPARPGSGVTGDPSGNLGDLQEVSGVVIDLRSGLILIALDHNGEFMLRMSDNTQWDAGATSKVVKVGNSMTCRVKPEPTLAPPSQGEVYRVLKNIEAN